MRFQLFGKIVVTMLTLYVIQLFSPVCTAQSFPVPGNSNHKWTDTMLDLKPGTLVQLAAKGEVDVGAGWGVYGPEGTRKFADVPGYPAETTYRYGLVARVTQSRTNPDDDFAYWLLKVELAPRPRSVAISTWKADTAAELAAAKSAAAAAAIAAAAPPTTRAARPYSATLSPLRNSE